MKMHSVNDKNLQLLGVGYEPVDGILRCRWRKGYGEHRGVPEDVFLKLIRVPFAYNYYTKVVKNKYPYTRIEDPPEEVNGRGQSTRTDCGCSANQPTGPDSNSGTGSDHQPGRFGHTNERDALLPGRICDSGRNDRGTERGAVMERNILELNCFLWE